MKTIWKILIPLLLLALLLIGGGLLYRQLSQQILPMTGETEENEAVPRHQGEYASIDAEPSSAPTEDATAVAEETAELPAEENAEAPISLSDDPTADFTVYDELGELVSLSDFFGKPIVVNVWATWCPPCRAELPYFDDAAKRYEGQIRFMMIDLTDGATDTVDSATAFAREENGYGFPLYFDKDFSAVEAYQINAIPVTLFVRADGSLLHQQIGSMDEATLESYIQQLLKEN